MLQIARPSMMATREPPSQKAVPNMGPPQVPQVPSEKELKQLSQDELIRRLRWCESDRIRRMTEHNAMAKDVNKRMQDHILESRSMKSANQQLQKDNQELRDLCCFLDDDRTQGRNLAKEWQKFGRYTASVMRTEVDRYPMKLKELEDKQKQLIQENLELKEICFLLDQERAGNRNSLCSNCNSALTLQPRDQGDGSSGSLSPREQKNSQVDDHTKTYIQRLEDRIHSLEEDKRLMGQATWGSGSFDSTLPKHIPPPRSTQGQNDQPPPGRQHAAPIENGPQPTLPTTKKPEAVMHALKVLEVHEKLDTTGLPSNRTASQSDNLNDNEKAIVREMCNVVWRKLGDAPPDAAPAPQSNEPRLNAAPRNSMGSTGPHSNAPPRYSNAPGNQYMGSTSSLDRVEKKGIRQSVMTKFGPNQSKGYRAEGLLPERKKRHKYRTLADARLREQRSMHYSD